MMRCLLAGLLLLSTVAVAKTPVKVMSFNIRFGSAKDGPNAWPRRRALVAETVRKYKPDILGTQECLAFQAAYLAEELPHYHCFGMGRDADGGGEYTAVFCRKRAFCILEAGHFWLSEVPETPGSVSWDSSMTRMATWLRLLHRKSGVVVHVFNTHFDHRGEEARREAPNYSQRAPRRFPPVSRSSSWVISTPWPRKASPGRPWQALAFRMPG